MFDRVLNTTTIKGNYFKVGITEQLTFSSKLFAQTVNGFFLHPLETSMMYSGSIEETD